MHIKAISTNIISLISDYSSHIPEQRWSLSQIQSGFASSEGGRPFPGPLEAELCVLLTRYWARKEVHRSVKTATDSRKHLSLISLSYTPTFQQTAPDGIFLLFSQLREVLIDSTLCFFSALHCKGFSNLNTEASPHCYSFVNSLRSQWLYGCSQQGAACSPLPEAL